MSLEDPFFVVKDEVQKAVSNARSLYQRWCELLEDPSAVSKEEYDWTTNELRNSLRSIEWDLEDLDETIGIVETNPKKFKIDLPELEERKNFVLRTKELVKEMKDHMASPSTKSREERKSRQSLMPNGPKRGQDKYTRLENDIEQSNQRYLDDTRQQQQLIMSHQDEQLEKVGDSVTVLKSMGQTIGNELDEQAVMLDDFSTEMERTDSKLDGVMKKMAKVTRMSNDRRQWMAIGVLIIIMIVVIVLFFVL
ncbi:syntaxin-6-like [Ptychodera flava]|uniref:syntaxin-6-like n=1 Tax=Ptychodera flava TaxID=63121 RepID=UPI00396A30A1